MDNHSLKKYGYFIRILICITKFLQLNPLKITKDIHGNIVCSEILLKKVIFCMTFHLTASLFYFATCISVWWQLENVIMRFTAIFKTTVNCFCHASAVVTYLIHCKRIYQLLWSTRDLTLTILPLNGDRIFKKMLFLCSKIVILCFCVTYAAIRNRLELLSTLINISWFVLSSTTFIVDFHFLILIEGFTNTFRTLNNTLPQIKEEIIISKNDKSLKKGKLHTLSVSGNTVSHFSEQKYGVIFFIKCIMNQHNDICNLISEVNNIYAPVLLIKALKLFIVMTHIGFYIMVCVGNQSGIILSNLIGLVAWLSLEAIDLYGLLHTCDIFMREV
ncbi:hypothetical protein L9F63_010390, partial [Diploptera punctata]